MSTNIDRRSFLRFVSACPALAFTSESYPTGVGRALVGSDGHLENIPIVLSGEFGYEQKIIRDLPAVTIDARRASFIVANSRNPDPNALVGCDMGLLPVNRYPLVIRNCPGVHFIGGRFGGEVPLTTDWRDTYCNSAALLVRDGTSRATVEGVRARRCWDGIRLAEGANGFRLKGCWLSEIRDDAIENDYLLSGIIEDCLFDGCFAGVSLDPASNDRDGREEVVTIDRSLVRMNSYIAKGELTHQAPVKAAEAAPKLRIRKSIFALSSANMRGFPRLKRTWKRMIESGDNALLWLPNEPIPSDLPLPPSGFVLLKGAEARDYWDVARRRWVLAHPDVPRFSDDEV